jgi:hypothetical protein
MGMLRLPLDDLLDMLRLVRETKPLLPVTSLMGMLLLGRLEVVKVVFDCEVTFAGVALGLCCVAFVFSSFEKSSEIPLPILVQKELISDSP